MKKLLLFTLLISFIVACTKEENSNDKITKELDLNIETGEVVIKE